MESTTDAARRAHAEPEAVPEFDRSTSARDVHAAHRAMLIYPDAIAHLVNREILRWGFLRYHSSPDGLMSRVVADIEALPGGGRILPTQPPPPFYIPLPGRRWPQLSQDLRTDDELVNRVRILLPRLGAVGALLGREIDSYLSFGHRFELVNLETRAALEVVRGFARRSDDTRDES